MKSLPFILYALYLWLWVNPSLYLIRSYREFFTDAYFLRSYLDFPGEPAEYATRFITQLYQFPLVASLLISGILFCIYLLVFIVCKGLKYRDRIAAIPVAALMLMHTNYRHTVRFDLDILAVCLILFLFISSFGHRKWLPYVAYPLLLAALLYLNGILAAGAFILLSGLLCAWQKSTPARFAGMAAGIAAVCLLFCGLFHLTIHDARQEAADLTRNASFACDPDERNGLYVQHYARNGQWEKALTCARKCRYPDQDVVLYTNQALYFTGKLTGELFLYNQSLGSAGLLGTEITNYSGIVPNQDVFLHLGALSLSIIWGTEATNVYGANPYVLKNLVKAYLANGYIIEADKILNQLDRTPFCRKWAAAYRRFTSDTTLIRQDAELDACRRAQAPLAVVSTRNTLMNLYLLMKDTPANRMAYDYLLTGSLLDHKIEYFASYLTGLKDYGYTSIPKLYFEGLVYNSLYARQSPINIRDFTFDAGIIQRFDAFRQDLTAALRNPDTIAAALEAKYGDTYWYYLLFRSRLPDTEKAAILQRLIS